MTDQAPTPTGITTRESLAALAYFTLHLAFSFWSPGSEMRNYLTLVAGPLFLVVFLRAGESVSGPRLVRAAARQPACGLAGP